MLVLAGPHGVLFGNIPQVSRMEIRVDFTQEAALRSGIRYDGACIEQALYSSQAMWPSLKVLKNGKGDS